MDQLGGGARFKQTGIDHNRGNSTLGRPRYPGRPDGAKDAMPRRRTSQKPSLPSWAFGMLNPKGAPDWAQKARQAQVGMPEMAPPDAITNNPLTNGPNAMDPRQMMALRKRAAMLRGGLGGGLSG